MRFDMGLLLEQLDGAPAPDEAAARLTAVGFNVELREPMGGSEVWDVEVTTNRPDAMNHRGLAREAAVATGCRLRPLEVDLREAGEPTAELVAVEIEAPEACRRFCSRVVRGVSWAPSPQWLQERLERCGVRPISAVVDVTNYVLLLLGQPLHAYDLERVRGRRLVARMAREGEALTTLDGARRTLESSMPVIADARGAVGLAGVMGGADTEIGPDTRDVWLEAASFEPVAVRRMARRLGMHTEASHRFERGADPELPPLAVDLAAAMIAELAGGTVCRGRIDVNPRPHAAVELEMTASGVSRFAGLEIAAATVTRILDGLGFSPLPEGDAVRCTVPSWRVDVERTADLYEEVIRQVGYDAVPSVLPVLSTAPGERSPSWRLVDRARDAAVAAGLVEVVTYSFIEPEVDDLVTGAPLDPGRPLALVNPLARTQGTMRRSLLPGLLAAVRDALNQGERDVAVFEQGRSFWADGTEPRESERLALALTGSTGSWERSEPVRFATLKGLVEEVADRVPMPAREWRRGGAPWVDEAEGALIVGGDGRVLGYAGRVSPATADRFDLRQAVYAAELDLAAAVEPEPRRFAPLPRHPAVAADVTVEHDRGLEFAELERVAAAAAGPLVERLQLVARYEGEGLPTGKVRTTLRLLYRHGERSLTQDEVNREQEELRARLADRLGVRFA